MLEQKRLPAEKRKKIILRAAIEEFSNSNYRVAKMSDIAKGAGVTEPMLYRFFDSKKSLFLEILSITGNKAIEMFCSKELIEIENIKTRNDFRDVLQKNLWALVSSMEKSRNHLKVFYQAISEVDDYEVKQFLNEHYKKTVDFYKWLFQIAIEKGILENNINPLVLAWDVLGYTIQEINLFIIGFSDKKMQEILLYQRLKLWIP